MSILPAVPPRTLAGTGFLLRVLERGDWSVDHALSRDAAVLAGTTFPRLLTEEQARQRVARAVMRRDAMRSTRYVIDDDGASIGIAGVSARSDVEVEVFYALLPAGRGRGIAAATARLLADWATAAGARRVVLVTFPDNIASRRTAEHAGFVVIGRESRAGSEREGELWLYQASAARPGP